MNQIRRRCATVCVACAITASGCCAQINVVRGTAYWQWEISTDLGASWRQGVIDVEANQPFVDVRARCLFDQESDRFYYGGVLFDGIVRGAQVGDSIGGIEFGTTLFGGAVVQRFSDVLKVDRSGDDLPPGEGPRWLSPLQPSPIVGRINDFSNPFEMFSYRLYLDGTPGEREIGAVFRDVVPPGVPQGLYVIVYENFNTSTTYFQSLQVGQASVRIVPTCGTCAVACLFTRLLFQRRRH